MLKPVTRVPFVYGGHYYVATDDLNNLNKTYLPLYTKAGFRFDETPRGRAAIRRHEATTLHRNNIRPFGSMEGGAS